MTGTGFAAAAGAGHAGARGDVTCAVDEPTLPLTSAHANSEQTCTGRSLISRGILSSGAFGMESLLRPQSNDADVLRC
jgi:hypothetical protein